MDGQGSIVGLDDSIGHFGGGEHGEGAHDTIGVLFANLGDQQCAHA